MIAGINMKGIVRSLFFGRNCLTRALRIWILHLLLFLIKIRFEKKFEKSKLKRNTKSKLMELPNDIMVDILMKLPVKSLCCIQCASKTCLNIVECPLFATLHTPLILNSTATNPAAVEVPQLMLLARSCTANDNRSVALRPWKYNGKYTLRPWKYNGKYTLGKTKHALLLSKNFSQQLFYGIEFVFCNLFCFQSEMGFGSCYLLNPLRKEVLKLPTSNIEIPEFFGNWYGMGFDNRTSTYKIVRISRNRKDTNHVAQVYVLGTNSSWRRIQSFPPYALSDRKASAYGDMHWLIDRDKESYKYHIISFDFKKEEFNWTPHPNLQLDFVNIIGCSGIHLVNLKGSLAIIGLSSYIEIWMLKNYDKKEWALDYKIGTQMFQPHPFNFFRSTSTCGVWEHGIFFVDDKHVCYFLDLQYGSMNRITLGTCRMGQENSIFRGIRIFTYTESLISLKSFGNLVNTTLVNGDETPMYTP